MMSGNTSVEAASPYTLTLSNIPASGQSFTINWGDGTPNTVMSGPFTSTSLSITHIFQPSWQPYQITATATDGTNTYNVTGPQGNVILVSVSPPITASVTAPGEVTLNWSAYGPAPVQFEIDESTDGITYTAADDVSGSQTSDVIDGLGASANYSFQVVATDLAGNAVTSQPVSASFAAQITDIHAAGDPVAAASTQLFVTAMDNAGRTQISITTGASCPLRQASLRPRSTMAKIKTQSSLFRASALMYFRSPSQIPRIHPRPVIWSTWT